MKSIIVILLISVCVLFSVQNAISQDVVEGLVGYWDFNTINDDNVVEDISGNGHHGMLIGKKKIESGKYGNSLSFNGIDTEVVIPYHTNLNPEMFTITAWGYVSEVGSGHRSLLSSRSDNPQCGYILYCLPNNNWSFWIGTGSQTKWQSINGSKVSIGDWDFLVSTYEKGSQKFYINGDFVSEKNFEIALNTEEELLIGSGANESQNHNFFFSGMIDEVRIYDRVLTETEMESVMNSESLSVDLSLNLPTMWGEIKESY